MIGTDAKIAQRLEAHLNTPSEDPSLNPAPISGGSQMTMTSAPRDQMLMVFPGNWAYMQICPTYH